MRTVPINIEITASTRVRPEAVERWLKRLGVSDKFFEELDETEEDISDPALLIALAAKRCYNSFEPGLNPNVTKVRKDWTEYLTNILAQGHGSVMEHASYSIGIDGVSRVFTGEMNRHRAGVAVSEASMRYIRYEDIPYWLPTSITLTPAEILALSEADQDIPGTDQAQPIPEDKVPDYLLGKKKQRSQTVFKRAFGQMEDNYKELENIWADELKPDAKFAGKKHVTSMMRRIVGMGVATGGVWTLNMRALRHVMAMRASAAAEEEILHVWSRAGKMMIEEEPILLGDFTQTPEGYWVPKFPKV